MLDKEIINIFKSLMPFLATVCGSDCEIVLHDLSSPHATIIAVENNQTGRKIGEPLTDFAKTICDDKLYEDKEFIANYFGHAGGEDFRSSTYFIKNEGRLVGLLCLNKNLRTIRSAKSAIAAMITSFNMELEPVGNVRENLETSVDLMMTRFIADTIHSRGISPTRMSRDEKVEIVHQLNEHGILKTKGAISEIATRLGVSEPTIYRYLKESI